MFQEQNEQSWHLQEKQLEGTQFVSTKCINVKPLRGNCVNTVSEFERSVNRIYVYPEGKIQKN